MLLDLRSRDVYILLTDTKALRSTRVPMGSKNSTAALGRATSVILADLLHELAIYADDYAGGKAEPEDLINLLELRLELQRARARCAVSSRCCTSRSLTSRLDCDCAASCRQAQHVDLAAQLARPSPCCWRRG
jgi:hypothetical protein